jgi:hypothetical protein
MNTKKIEPRAVLFRVGGLGDLLVALPAIALVRRALPGYRLTLVGREEYASLLVRAGVVEGSMSFNDPMMATIFADYGTSAPGRNNEQGQQTGREETTGRPDSRPNSQSKPAQDPLIDWTSGIELVTGWRNSRGDWPADEWWGRQGIGRTCFITYDCSSGQPMSRFFFDRTADFFKIPSPRVSNVAPHDRDEAAAFGTNIGARADEREVGKGDTLGPGKLIAGDPDKLFDDCAGLELPAALIKKDVDVLNLSTLMPGEKRLVVHPGSGGRAKRWPLPNFIEAVRRAASRGVNGVLVTGEAEEDLEPALDAATLPAGWTWVSRLPAETLAGLLASSTHYIGNDSGPTHLAAACGARVLAFFRDENLPAWRPFGRTRVLSAPALDRIQLSSALPVIDDFLAS